jgi:hypothetical protein
MDTTTLTPAVAPETVTPLRPSEAMRLGCLIAPVQAFDTYMAGNSACALGAVALAMGKNPLDVVFPDWSHCPACSEINGADSLVIHLNDEHRWSREDIATWLEGLGL